ncbi:hypothetical protein [Micrococcus terreus]|uniref:hypothetical protein n=1 Tax=Micrococcus terreus TaxID=574650 RepID=UPI003D74D428
MNASEQRPQSRPTDPVSDASINVDPDLSADPTPVSGEERSAGDSALDRETLEDYLNQHLLGSRSGVKMFRTAAATWDGTEYADRLVKLADDVSADQDALEELIARLGMKTPALQEAAGQVAEVAGRLNPVNLTRSKGNGWTQVELDLLQGALQAKAAMWDVLAELADHTSELDRTEMERLYKVAQEQQAEVQRISEETLSTRFLGSSD